MEATIIISNYSSVQGKYRARNDLEGFSLIELLVTLAIVSILAMVATPSMKEAVLNSKVKSLSDELSVALSLAQSEAIKRSVQVTVRPKQTEANQWKSGWDIFADPNRNGLKDTDEELLQTHDFEAKGLTITSESSAFSTWLGFLPSGVTKGNSGINGGFRICRADGNTAKSRTIVVQASGNIIIEKGVTSCP